MNRATISSIQTSDSIFYRIAEGDRRAVKHCIGLYGNLVWSLARNLTDSFEEAEILTREIFIDIWKYAGNFNSDICDERAFIRLIARRKFNKLTEKS